MPKVRTKVDGYTGVRAGVSFVDGVGETDDPAALAYFRRKGYTVGGSAPVREPDGPPPKAGPGSGRDAWVAYAQRAGLEVDEDASRDDVIDAVENA